jgi:hypothetical protein
MELGFVGVFRVHQEKGQLSTEKGEDQMTSRRGDLSTICMINNGVNKRGESQNARSMPTKTTLRW